MPIVQPNKIPKRTTFCAACVVVQQNANAPPYTQQIFSAHELACVSYVCTANRNKTLRRRYQLNNKSRRADLRSEIRRVPSHKHRIHAALSDANQSPSIDARHPLNTSCCTTITALDMSRYPEWGMRGWLVLGSVPLMGSGVFIGSP